jgi:hypothetical protein
VHLEMSVAQGAGLCIPGRPDQTEDQGYSVLPLYPKPCRIELLNQ